MKLKIHCDWCGNTITRFPSQVKHFNFCSRSCLSAFSSKSKNPNGYSNLKDYRNMSKNMTRLNRDLNPTRMTPETRNKLRVAKLGSGEGKTYSKRFGIHEHRIVAEQILGRKLQPGEVVHHIDGDKRNNSPINLMVLKSQSEHAKLHIREKAFWNGGDAE